MKNLKRIFAVCVTIFSLGVGATPIEITQTYSNVSYSNYGVVGGVTFDVNPVGDWIFRATVDSDAANISLWPNTGAYQLSQLTLTQASLGLIDAAITNAPVLFFYPDRFGFSATYEGTTPWTVVVYERDHFLDASDLLNFLRLATTPEVTDDYTSFGPQWDGFELEDGRRLFGWGFGKATVTVSSVPEPSTFILLTMGCSMILFRLKARSR